VYTATSLTPWSPEISYSKIWHYCSRKYFNSWCFRFLWLWVRRWLTSGMLWL
jgi:hypothetical protein